MNCLIYLWSKRFFRKLKFWNNITTFRRKKQDLRDFSDSEGFKRQDRYLHFNSYHGYHTHLS